MNPETTKKGDPASPIDCNDTKNKDHCFADKKNETTNLNTNSDGLSSLDAPEDAAGTQQADSESKVAQRK